jgi:hypothetical protein
VTKRRLLIGFAAAGVCTGASAASAPIPIPIGVGSQYHISATSPSVARARPIHGLRCASQTPGSVSAHVELFANRRALLIPPGIGVAPPLEVDGGHIRGGRCFYPVRTSDPTGIVQFTARKELTLRDLFAVWGQRLTSARLATFRTRKGDRVRGYLAGKRWRGDVASIPLRRHAQIVLEIGGYVPPHRSFLFPHGR